MSAFNASEAVEYAARNNCPSNSYDVNVGTLKLAIACIPTNATSATEVYCDNYEKIEILATNTCETVISDTEVTTPGEGCYIYCTYFNPLAARGLPMDDYVTGAASTLHSSSLVFTFAALFFVALMFFKRSH